MKTLLAILALLLAGCAGNGIILGVQWTEPQTGATIELHTAK